MPYEGSHRSRIPPDGRATGRLLRRDTCDSTRKRRRAVGRRLRQARPCRPGRSACADPARVRNSGPDFGDNVCMARITSSLQKPGVLSALLTHARLAVRLLREPRVPLLAKVVPVLAAVYLVSPLDAVPDLIPVLGQLDDVGFVVSLSDFIHPSARSCT